MHGPCNSREFFRVFLLALLPGALASSNPTITLQVSSETAPPGGYAQFKIYLTEPALVSTAHIAMRLDPSIFGSPSIVAAFSATGDQIGNAGINDLSQLAANVSSPSASLGQLPGLPVFVVNVPVLVNSLTVPVTLTIGPGILDVAPTSLSFSLEPGQTSPAQTIAIRTPTPSIAVSTTTQSGGNWLIASAAGVAADVNATAANLGAGTYQGAVTITSPLNLAATVPVTLTVAPPPGPAQLAVTPSIALTAPAGSTATGNLSVTSISGPPYFAIQSNGPIVQVTPSSSSGQYTAPITLQVSASAPLPGTYQYSLTVSWNGGSATVPVRLYATASPSTPPVMSAIVNSGSAIPGPVAPGELITIFGAGLGAPGLQIGSAGKMATSLSGTKSS